MSDTATLPGKDSLDDAGLNGPQVFDLAAIPLELRAPLRPAVNERRPAPRMR